MNGNHVGVNGKGWIVDITARYPGDFASTGASLQLTGPGVHETAPPFPGTFGAGADPSFPHLVVVISTTPDTAPFHGPGTNLPNLFNVTGVGTATARVTVVRDTWIVAAPYWAAQKTPKRANIYVAITAGQAPDVVPDANKDGRITAFDIRHLGLVSPVVVRTFFVNPVMP